MGIFFRKMSKTDSENWNKACIFGFYIFLATLFIDGVYYYFYDSNAFSNSLIFWIGLISAITYEFILNHKAKRELNN